MCLAGCSDYPESCESCRSIKHSRHTRVLDSSVSNILWLNGLCLLAFQFEARVCLSWSLVLGGGFVWLLHADSFCLSLCLFRVLENSRKICYRQHRVASFTLQRSQTYKLAHTELELSACRAIYQGHECPGQPNACPRPCQSSSVCHFASQCPCPWQCQFNTRLLRVFAQPNAIRVQLCGVQKCLPGTNPPQKTYCQNVVIVGVFGWMEWIIAENKSLKSNKDFAVILRLPFIIVKYLLRPK